MLKIFYAKQKDYSSSSELLKKILNEYFSISEYEIFKNENGKPFLTFENAQIERLFFSVSHTDFAYFIAVSSENIGIDAEPTTRTPNYLPILQKFSVEERETIFNSSDFLKLWTVKESAIKWLGGSIAKDLKKIVYINKTLTLNGLELPISVIEIEFFDHFLSICKEKVESPIFQAL